MSNSKVGITGDVINWLRGLCMGAADIVPGVSGGTMALILGHYERLVNAISHVDRTFFKLLLDRKIKEALQHIDFRFIVALGIGILTGIVALASLLSYLLSEHQAYTYAVFSGLIIGSSYLVSQRLKTWSWAGFAWMLFGAIIAWQICILQPMHGTLSPLTAFLAATVAICAMILPGISGAFILLLLGLYHPVTDLIKGLPKGEFEMSGLIVLAAFGTGCLVGLLSFSRLLKWLLANKHDHTLSFLGGLMMGSLYKIWPFQRVTPETAELELKERQFELLWPGESTASLTIVIMLTGLALVATIALEQVGKRLGDKEEESPQDQTADENQIKAVC